MWVAVKLQIWDISQVGIWAKVMQAKSLAILTSKVLLSEIDFPNKSRVKCRLRSSVAQWGIWLAGKSLG